MEKPLGAHTEATTVQSPDQKAHRLFIFGLFASVAYTGALAVYSWHEWVQMRALNPDEFATFLSGAFAPLAFLWLVLGFRQQGDELQNSARALWLQGEELRNSVEQQRQLVEVSREQLQSERQQRHDDQIEAERAAQPLLVLAQNGGTYSNGQANLDYLLTNARSTCSDVVIFVNDEMTNRTPVLALGGEVRFRISFSQDNAAENHIVVRYTDIFGSGRLQRFMVPLNGYVEPNGSKTHGRPIMLGPPERSTDF